jgi:hypothetical protein
MGAEGFAGSPGPSFLTWSVSSADSTLAAPESTSRDSLCHDCGPDSSPDAPGASSSPAVVMLKEERRDAFDCGRAGEGDLALPWAPAPASTDGGIGSDRAGA